MLFLELLNQPEKEADGFVMTFNPQFHVASIVLDNLNVDEFITQALNDAE